MWRLLRRVFGGQGWVQDPLMPRAAELLLADLDPATRRQVWKAAAAHAGRTAGHVEMFATNFLIIVLCPLFILDRDILHLPSVTHGYVFAILFWAGFPWIFFRTSNSVLGRRRAIRYVRIELAKLGRCPACGYDLRATPGCCPECGAVPQLGEGRRAGRGQRD